MVDCASWPRRVSATATSTRGSWPRRRPRSPSWATTPAPGLEGFYKDRALYHQARIAELRSNPADATRIYHEVLDKNPTTSLREEITNRLASLEMK